MIRIFLLKFLHSKFSLKHRAYETRFRLMQVVELNLADNRILVIPPAIGEMWQLQELKLDHNKVWLSRHCDAA